MLVTRVISKLREAIILPRSDWEPKSKVVSCRVERDALAVLEL